MSKYTMQTEQTVQMPDGSTRILCRQTVSPCRQWLVSNAQNKHEAVRFRRLGSLIRHLGAKKID